LRRAVDVRIEHPDRGSFGRERQREIDGGRAFSDAPLPGSDCDDVPHARDQLHAALNRVRDDFHRHVHVDARDTRNALQLCSNFLPDRLDLAFGRVTEEDIDGNAVAFDPDVAR
jgi:hypothetical protein